MIHKQLIINNYTRDYFCDEYIDTFELVQVEGEHYDYYSLEHNGVEVAKLNDGQLRELVNYLQSYINN